MAIFSLLLKLGLVLLLSLILGLSSCGNSWVWHERLTVTVDTPDGTKSASGVLKTEFYEKPFPRLTPDAPRTTYTHGGEAIALEVKPGRYIFALLNSLPYTFDLFYPEQPPLDAAPKLMEDDAIGATITMPPSSYPLLVTFENINDPTSLKLVDPNDIQEAFGPGYKLRSITITITNEPVTKGRIESILSW
ncbi:hypothetical protein SAMN06297251_13321 [Fulvimarina manganoxydans]|uniref:Uncharacterized protein n=1 Tax=Fulvimarina manganoxydans TaxID=937218 RepID=A0A1W2ET33_9HYPH|nr:hypothetical protein [Fulvimarina manganoxydans]SMD12873.1 hypothetical protein SAMN06297251_13321 [Fulvimarina manganoxydans]